MDKIKVNVVEMREITAEITPEELLRVLRTNPIPLVDLIRAAGDAFRHECGITATHSFISDKGKWQHFSSYDWDDGNIRDATPDEIDIYTALQSLEMILIQQRLAENKSK